MHFSNVLESAGHSWVRALKWNSRFLLISSNDHMFHPSDLVCSFIKNNKQLLKTMERCVNFSYI